MKSLNARQVVEALERGYLDYELWARDKGFPVMSEDDWRAQRIVDAVEASALGYAGRSLDLSSFHEWERENGPHAAMEQARAAALAVLQ